VAGSVAGEVVTDTWRTVPLTAAQKAAVTVGEIGRE
jgi:hypothetical protein